MTIEQLIEKLKLFDPNTTVVVRGFDELGFADIQSIEVVRAVKREAGVEVFGEYQIVTDSFDDSRVISLLKIDHS